MPWRNAAEKNDHAWENSDAWNVNHDSNAVRDTIDGYIATSGGMEAFAITPKSAKTNQASWSGEASRRDTRTAAPHGST
ncbi:MAG: hypothetical protein GY924_12815 [Planctomycetaceae bacterium]|nr:hypothetical protein [Planctomycetaceae bacterium]